MKSKHGLRKWKSLSLVIAVALAVAGCGGGTGSGGSSGSPSASSPNGSAPGTQTASAEPAKRGRISASVYDRGTVPAEEGTMTDNRWTKWINEQGPADVEFVSVPRFESLQKFNVLLASGKAPDLLFEYDTAFHGQLYNQKQLMPLDDLIEQYSTVYKQRLEQYPALKKAGMMADGKLYAVGRPLALNPQHYLFIRNDWLKKLNLQAPKTPEELLAVAKAFTEQDPDGNGKADTQGIGLSFVAGIILNHMFGSGFTLFGTDQVPWILNDKDEVVHDWDRMQAAIAFQKQIYDAGVADKDFVTDKNGEKQKQAWITGKLGIYGGNGADVKVYETLKANVPEADVVPIALPKTAFGGFSPLLTTPVQVTAVVNASAKDPEAVIKTIDFMSTEEYATTIEYGFDGVHSKYAPEGCPVEIDPEKNKAERNYNRDLNMLAALDGPCYQLANKPNPTPAQQDMIRIVDMAREAYMNPEAPMVGITQRNYLPLLPQDLQTINTNANKTILDMAMKTIVSGSSYPVDKFMGDAKSAWEKAGGEKVDAFYADWYKNNKDNAILMDDIYGMIK